MSTKSRIASLKKIKCFMNRNVYWLILAGHSAVNYVKSTILPLKFDVVYREYLIPRYRFAYVSTTGS